MSSPYRFISVGLLPVFTLVVGWQLGQKTMEQRVMGMESQIEALYGGSQSQSGSVLTDPEREADIGLLWGVWRLLLSRYIEPAELDTERLIYGAVAGLVESVGDPYTLFMTPTENTDFRDSLNGHLQGIGAELTQRENQIIIVSPLKGSPAERAGLQPEDVIVAVDAQDVLDQNLNEVVMQIRGEKGTNVTLSVYREGEADLLEFTITRDDITVPSAEYEVKEVEGKSVGYLAINQFGNDTIREVRSIIQNQIKEEDLKGLIVDLRYNGGGYLAGAIELTSMFLGEGDVVTVKGREDKDAYHVNGNPLLPSIPLVVLINQASASASEIVAGALQDHGRATIVGMTSFGKGTVQEVIDLPGGSSLRVTTATWLTPSGRDLGKEGVEPDIEVERTREDIEADRDPQLDKALEIATQQ